MTDKQSTTKKVTVSVAKGMALSVAVGLATMPAPEAPWPMGMALSHAPWQVAMATTATVAVAWARAITGKGG